MGDDNPGWREGGRQIKSGLTRIRTYLHWLRYEFLPDPRYQLYARKVGEADRAAFLADQARGDVAVRDMLAPYAAADLPRIIWMYWHDGEDAAPMVVRRCIQSWRRHNPGWEVRVLDKASMGAHVDMADMGNLAEGLPNRFLANILRIRLILHHGGVWSDATAYCHRPLDDWLPLQMSTGAFMLSLPGTPRWAESWFLAGQPGHLLYRVWETAYARYLKRLRYKPDLYFPSSYMFQWALKTDAAAMDAFDRKPRLPAQPCFVMMAVLRDQLPPERLEALLGAGLPFSKLTWKEILDETAFDAFCARIDKG